MQPEFKFLKLEAGWILTNVAYGSEQVQRMLITPEFVRIVNTLIQQQPVDLVLLDQLLFMLGNITGTDKEMRKIIRQNFDLVTVINNVLQ